MADHRGVRGGGAAINAGLAISAFAGILLGACGSSSGTSEATGPVSAVCHQIEAVLSDGPDPNADPVGYAQAQVLPLRALHTSDGALQKAIDELAAAYQGVVAAGGTGKATAKQVAVAGKNLDAFCPGAV